MEHQGEEWPKRYVWLSECAGSPALPVYNWIFVLEIDSYGFSIQKEGWAPKKARRSITSPIHLHPSSTWLTNQLKTTIHLQNEHKTFICSSPGHLDTQRGTSCLNQRRNPTNLRSQTNPYLCNSTTRNTSIQHCPHRTPELKIMRHLCRRSSKHTPPYSRGTAIRKSPIINHLFDRFWNNKPRHNQHIKTPHMPPLLAQREPSNQIWETRKPSL